MRASEYATQFKAEGSTIEAAGRVVWAMIMEIKELAQKRHVREDHAFVSILEELQQKWEAFVRQAGSLNNGDAINPQGFEYMVGQKMPAVYAPWMEFRQRKLVRPRR